MPRFWMIPALLVVLVVVPFLIWGEDLTGTMTVDPQTGRLTGTDMHPGLAGIGLLTLDLFLPVPTTSVIAALGIIYGAVTGTLWALLGSMLAASTGYALGRIAGRPIASRWLGDHMVAGERAFRRYGGWLVAASRWMPVLPEVVSVSAGVSRMPLPTFLAAALCGAAPHCALFATLGHLGADAPGWTLLISAAIPLLIWYIADRAGITHSLGQGTRSR